MRFFRFSVLAFLATSLASFGPSPISAQDDRPRVAVSTPLLADIVRNVAGEEADVFSVMPENADPHTWEASPHDLARVTEADSFVSIGANLEPFIESGGWRRTVSEAEIPELVITDHVELIEVDRVIDHGDHVHDLREGDPHVWLDPTKIVAALPAIGAHLSALDPDGAGAYETNVATYAAALTALDHELQTAFEAIPLERRALIVFHDAYTYFAARYGFEVIGVVLQNPDAEISAQEVVDLLDIIAEYDVPVIFAEPQFDTEILDIFVQESGVEIGELLTDAFAGRVTSYVGLMRYNRDSLLTHLG